MKIAIMRERAEGEPRVAATPETVTKLMALGADVTVEAGAGDGSRLPDADFRAAGATVVANAQATVRGADVILAVRRPDAGVLHGTAPGALVIAMFDPYGNEGALAEIAATGVTAMSMEFMPRITRAQVMDVLSSQANLAGYQGVIDAAANFDRAFPMMMTAAGTIRPAKVFVMGAGVAGLQAIATARRLGAVVTATDVRPAAKEQVESLGGKFIAVEDDEFKQAETAGGYAKEMSDAYKAKQAALTASHISKQDIVITTALIPGRPAPKLISRAMVESMAPGSVLVDLAAERGGNVEVTVPGRVINHNGVTIVGYRNMPGRIATSASQLYARNLYAFIETLIDRKEKKLAVNWDDELVKATVLTRGGAVVHANFVGRAAPAAAPASPASKVQRTEPVAVPAMAQTPTPPSDTAVESAPVVVAEPVPTVPHDVTLQSTVELTEPVPTVPHPVTLDSTVTISEPVPSPKPRTKRAAAAKKASPAAAKKATAKAPRKKPATKAATKPEESGEQ